MEKIRIISDGISFRTRVETLDGKLLEVTKIELDPIEANSGFVTAKLTFKNVELNIVAEKKE